MGFMSGRFLPKSVQRLDFSSPVAFFQDFVELIFMEHVSCDVLHQEFGEMLILRHDGCDAGADDFALFFIAAVVFDLTDSIFDLNDFEEVFGHVILCCHIISKGPLFSLVSVFFER